MNTGASAQIRLKFCDDRGDLTCPSRQGDNAWLRVINNFFNTHMTKSEESKILADAIRQQLTDDGFVVVKGLVKKLHLPRAPRDKLDEAYTFHHAQALAEYIMGLVNANEQGDLELLALPPWILIEEDTEDQAFSVTPAGVRTGIFHADGKGPYMRNLCDRPERHDSFYMVNTWWVGPDSSKQLACVRRSSVGRRLTDAFSHIYAASLKQQGNVQVSRKGLGVDAILFKSDHTYHAAAAGPDCENGASQHTRTLVGRFESLRLRDIMNRFRNSSVSEHNKVRLLQALPWFLCKDEYSDRGAGVKRIREFLAHVANGRFMWEEKIATGVQPKSPREMRKLDDESKGARISPGADENEKGDTRKIVQESQPLLQKMSSLMPTIEQYLGEKWKTEG